MKPILAPRGRRRGLAHIDEEVGARLRLFRLHRALSQTKLGDKLVITFQQVQKYERGANSIAMARIPAFCAILDVTANDFFGDLFKSGKRDALPQLSATAVRAAMMIDRLPQRVAPAILRLLGSLTGDKEFDDED